MYEPTALRRSVYVLMIVVAGGLACGHIVSAQRVYEPAQHRADAQDRADRRPVWPAIRPAALPIFSSNDRSRWATVAALVDEGSYVIGQRDVRTIHASALAPLGQLDPLGAAALAGAGYFARVGRPSNRGIIFEPGWESVDKVLDPNTLRFYSSKPPLLATLMAGLYWLLRLATGWTLATHPNAVIRTLLLLVNGVPFVIYLWQLVRLVETWGRTDWGRLYVVAAGAFATLVGPFLITFSNHTTGTFAVMAAWLALLRIGEHEGDAPPWYQFVVAGFFAAFAVACELPALAFAAAVFALLLWRYPRPTLLLALPPALLVAAAFFATNYAAVGMLRPAYSEFGGPWYEYEGSHWRPMPEGVMRYGIDWARRTGREGPAMYAVHVLIGHHGVFSLTPVWLLAFAGMLRWRGGVGANPQAGVLGLALSVVVVGFYLYSSDNYGGWTQGLRWLMWLTPIWLTCLLPMADWLAERRWGRGLGYALLAVSVFSASYEPWNPWRHPWLYDLMVALGWPGY